MEGKRKLRETGARKVMDPFVAARLGRAG